MSGVIEGSDNLSEYQQEMSRLKFEILAKGVRITKEAKELLFGSKDVFRAKTPLRTRSGASGGLDLRLSNEIFVNAPVFEPFALTSDLELRVENSSFCLSKNGHIICPIMPLPEPCFYVLRTKDGIEEMARIAQMCSPDRLCYSMTGSRCAFWTPRLRCKFCSIGLNSKKETNQRLEAHLYEVIEAALSEPQWPARHLLIGGGCPGGRDMGALLAAQLCAGIKRRFDISVYVMIAAPLEDQYINILYDAGVDELGINLEFWSDVAWEHYIPGKRDLIGKRRYLKALEYAYNLFGPIRTRSILVAGLEPVAETIQGVKTLCNMGIMPILSPFRPLAGTLLEHESVLSVQSCIDLYNEAKKLTESSGLTLGPTCICCQNNTLSLPFGTHYRWYGDAIPPSLTVRREQ